MGQRRVAGLLLSLGLFLTFVPARADDWPQWLGPQRDGTWRETGLLDKFPQDGLKVRWKAPINTGYTGPAVVGDRVFVMDRVVGQGGKTGGSNFARGGGAGSERVLCLSDKDGSILWKHEYDCPYQVMYPLGPRCTPTVDGGRAYTLGAMGHLFCFDASTGRVIWAKDLPKEYKTQAPPAGYATHPLVDGNKLICAVGGKDANVVAFDKDTGKELWRALNAAEIGYCPPMIFDHHGQRLLIVWHPEAVNGLDPESGKVFWSKPFRCAMNMNIAAPRLENDLLFVTAYFDGSLMLKLDAAGQNAEVAWGGKGSGSSKTHGLNGMMCTPLLRDGHVYGVCKNGELRCLKADSGERIWETLAPTTGGRGAQWANAFIVPAGDRVFLCNEKGDLVMARLTPKGYEELGRTRLLEPTHDAGGRAVVWSHPAFANKSVYARNDKVIVCYSLAAE